MPCLPRFLVRQWPISTNAAGHSGCALGQRLRHFADHVTHTAGTANGNRVRSSGARRGLPHRAGVHAHPARCGHRQVALEAPGDAFSRCRRRNAFCIFSLTRLKAVEYSLLLDLQRIADTGCGISSSDGHGEFHHLTGREMFLQLGAERFVRVSTGSELGSIR
jgi:hypothetical protein